MALDAGDDARVPGDFGVPAASAASSRSAVVCDGLVAGDRPRQGRLWLRARNPSICARVSWVRLPTFADLTDGPLEAALPCAQVLEALDEFDGPDPLHLLEAELKLVT